MSGAGCKGEWGREQVGVGLGARGSVAGSKGKRGWGQVGVGQGARGSVAGSRGEWGWEQGLGTGSKGEGGREQGEGGWESMGVGQGARGRRAVQHQRYCTVGVEKKSRAGQGRNTRPCSAVVRGAPTLQGPQPLKGGHSAQIQ